MSKLPLELLNINQLGERMLEIIENPKMYPPGQLRQIAEMLKTYKFGILVGTSFEDPAHVTAIATISTPYEAAYWNWDEHEGSRETGYAYRDIEFEETLEGQATMDGQFSEDDEEEDDDE